MRYSNPILRCAKCGYTWQARAHRNPKRCPNQACQTIYWRIPRWKEPNDPLRTTDKEVADALQQLITAQKIQTNALGAIRHAIEQLSTRSPEPPSISPTPPYTEDAPKPRQHGTTAKSPASPRTYTN
jgi:hypothetical protein